MRDIDWNAEFEQLAVHRLEADAARAATMKRKNSIEREHKARGDAISERERLRQFAIRLCRKAGVKGVGKDAFTERTKNQLITIIREAEAAISGNGR
jgi:hypothetical protein